MDPGRHCDLRKNERKLRDCMSVCKQAISTIALSAVHTVLDLPVDIETTRMSEVIVFTSLL